MDRALDVSNYSGSFGPEAVACWRSQDYAQIICGTQQPRITRAQLTTALAGGMSADAYVYLNWDASPAEQVRAALQTIDGLAVGRLWLDCEDAVGERAPAQVVALIGEAVAACGGFACGIYTGRWWWLPSTGDSAAFAHLPLWHAEYTASPDQLPSFEAFQAYGGWTRPLMWQYQGTTQLCGVSVDLNLRDVPITPPPADRPLPPLIIEELQALAPLRAERRFLAALFRDRYRFVVNGDAIELQQRRGGKYASLQPPVILRP